MKKFLSLSLATLFLSATTVFAAPCKKKCSDKAMAPTTACAKKCTKEQQKKCNKSKAEKKTCTKAQKKACNKAQKKACAKAEKKTCTKAQKKACNKTALKKCNKKGLKKEVSVIETDSKGLLQVEVSNKN